jgi:DNA-binding response OmpR family regulator
MVTKTSGSRMAGAEYGSALARGAREALVLRESLARVLVVEDDHEMCHAIGEALALSGVVADLAFDGKHGLMLATLRDYAVIVTDLRMPGIDGLALARYVQKMPDPPVVMIVTAYPSWRTEEEVRGVGASEVWVKPLDLSALVRRIQRFIQPIPDVAESGLDCDTPA